MARPDRSMRRLAASRGSRAAVALIVAGATIALHGAPSTSAVDAQAAANELIALTNVSRTSNGLSALPRDARLAAVGVSRSEDMLARDYFSHYIPPDNRTVVDILEALGVRFRAAGENIEFNDALDFTSVQHASADFMNSPSHRANVLNARWDRMGTGVAQSGNRKMYTVIFMQSPPATSGPGAEPLARPTFEADPKLEPITAPLPSPRPKGERAEAIVASSGLIDNLVDRLLRLFLNL